MKSAQMIEQEFQELTGVDQTQVVPPMESDFSSMEIPLLHYFVWKVTEVLVVDLALILHRSHRETLECVGHTWEKRGEEVISMSLT